MTSKIYVAKYIRDTRRWEPRNVGVIVVGAGGVGSRFLGEREDSTIDRRHARPVVADTANYEGWVTYWKETLEEQGPDAIEEILKLTKDNYWIVEAAEVRLNGESPDELIDTYFPQLVLSKDEVSEDEDPKLRPTIERVLKKAGLRDSPALQRDKSVRAMGFTRPVWLKFQYYYKNGRQTLAHGVSLQQPAFMRSTLYMFDHVSSEYDKVAFVSASDAQDDAYLAQVEASARMIDVSDPDAPDEVREVFGVH